MLCPTQAAKECNPWGGRSFKGLKHGGKPRNLGDEFEPQHSSSANRSGRLCVDGGLVESVHLSMGVADWWSHANCFGDSWFSHPGMTGFHEQADGCSWVGSMP